MNERGRDKLPWEEDEGPLSAESPALEGEGGVPPLEPPKIKITPEIAEASRRSQFERISSMSEEGLDEQGRRLFGESWQGPTSRVRNALREEWDSLHPDIAQAARKFGEEARERAQGARAPEIAPGVVPPPPAEAAPAEAARTDELVPEEGGVPTPAEVAGVNAGETVIGEPVAEISPEGRRGSEKPENPLEVLFREQLSRTVPEAARPVTPEAPPKRGFLAGVRERFGRKPKAEKKRETKEALKNLRGLVSGPTKKFLEKLPFLGKKEQAAAVAQVEERVAEEAVKKEFFGKKLPALAKAIGLGTWRKKEEIVAGAAVGFGVRTALRTYLGTATLPVAVTAGAAAGAAAGFIKEIISERKAYGSFVREVLAAGELTPETYLSRAEKLKEAIRAERENHATMKVSMLARGLTFMGGRLSREEELMDQLRYLNVLFKRQNEKGGKSLVDTVHEMLDARGVAAREEKGEFGALDARDDLIREIQESKAVDRTKLRNAIMRGAVFGGIGATVFGAWLELSQANNWDIAGAIGSLAREHGIGGVPSGNVAVPSPEASQTLSPTTAATEAPTPTPKPTPSAEPTGTPKATATPEATPSATPKPSPSPTPEATATPKPTVGAEASPSPKPPVSPSPEASASPKPPSAPETSPSPKPQPGEVPPTEVKPGGLEAAAGVGVKPLEVVLSPEVKALPETIKLPSGSNPWNEVSKSLKGILGRDPTNAEILRVTKAIAKEGIKVESWGLTEGIDQRALPVGFELRITPGTKTLIQQMVEGKLPPEVPEIPKMPSVPVEGVVPKVPDLPPELKALPETVHLPKGHNGLGSVARYLEGALGEKPTQAELLRMTRAVVKESGSDFIDKTAGWGSTEAMSQVILPADVDLKFTPVMKKIIQEFIEAPSLSSKLAGLSENVPLPKGVNGTATIARYFKEAFGRDPTLSELIKATRAVAKASGIDFIDKTAGWGSTEATSQVILPKDTVLKFTPKIKGLIQRIFEASRK